MRFFPRTRSPFLRSGLSVLALVAFLSPIACEAGQDAASAVSGSLIDGPGPQAASGGMVVSANAIASRVGAEVLRAGVESC